MNTQHTPGPWNLQVGVEENRCYVWGGKASPEQTFIAHVYCKLHGKVNRAEEKANARLIAAAPELLKVAREALTLLALSPHSFRFLPTVQKVEEKLDQTIAKAIQP